MMDRYSPLQMVGIYLCLAVFLTFILLPFVEMFMASLRPLEHLFRSPINFGLMISALKPTAKCGIPCHFWGATSLIQSLFPLR